MKIMKQEVKMMARMLFGKRAIETVDEVCSDTLLTVFFNYKWLNKLEKRQERLNVKTDFN
jgi:hypothetical protein